MTILLTLFGLIVFAVSLFTAGFKPAFIRLAMFAVVGVILDSIIIAIATTVVAVTA